MTLVSFLFFSLPIFWVAVLLKQYGAIRLNDWLGDPDHLGAGDHPDIRGRRTHLDVAPRRHLEATAHRVRDIGGSPRRLCCVYLSATHWFTDPSIGIVVYAALAIGIAVGVTAISTGLRNRKALYASLIVAGIGIALYYPMMNYLLNGMTLWLLLLLAVIAVVVSGAIGWFMGAPDRGPVVRTTAIVGFLVRRAHRARQVHVVLGGLRQLQPRPRPADRHRRRIDARVSAATSGCRASTCSRTCCCRRSRSS